MTFYFSNDENISKKNLNCAETIIEYVKEVMNKPRIFKKVMIF